MPADDRIGRNDEQGVAPFRPQSAEQNSECPISISKPRTWLLLLEGCELLAQGQVLQGQIISGSEPGSQETKEQTSHFQ